MSLKLQFLTLKLGRIKMINNIRALLIRFCYKILANCKDKMNMDERNTHLFLNLF